MTTHDVLVRARNEADRVWPERCVSNCIVDAVRLSGAADFLGPEGQESHCVIGRLLGFDWGDRAFPTSQIFNWNDTPGRTKEEVLALFDKAIAQTAPEPDVQFLTKEDEPVAVVA